MLRELAHFVRHAPGALWLKANSTQAEVYQALMLRADECGLRERRAALVRGVAGDVLEIGCGTGLMFPHYQTGVRVTAIEPDDEFLAVALDAARGSSASIHVTRGAGEHIDAATDSFDGAVVAMVLCSVPDPLTLLHEAQRVVKPGGCLRVLEHVCSERRVPAALMHAVNPIWLTLNGQGCNLDRNPLPAIKEAGFKIESVEPFQLFVPGLPAFPFKMICATS